MKEQSRSVVLKKDLKKRWNQMGFHSARGLPWEPTLGANGVELQSQIRNRDEDEIISEMGCPALEAAYPEESTPGRSK